MDTVLLLGQRVDSLGLAVREMGSRYEALHWMLSWQSGLVLGVAGMAVLALITIIGINWYDRRQIDRRINQSVAKAKLMVETASREATAGLQKATADVRNEQSELAHRMVDVATALKSAVQVVYSAQSAGLALGPLELDTRVQLMASAIKNLPSGPDADGVLNVALPKLSEMICELTWLDKDQKDSVRSCLSKLPESRDAAKKAIIDRLDALSEVKPATMATKGE